MNAQFPSYGLEWWSMELDWIGFLDWFIYEAVFALIHTGWHQKWVVQSDNDNDNDVLFTATTYFNKHKHGVDSERTIFQDDYEDMDSSRSDWSYVAAEGD